MRPFSHQEQPVQNRGSESPSGCCGPISGLADTLRLFCVVPGFWRLCTYQILTSAGCLLPLVYYVGPVLSQEWGDNAASNTLWVNAAGFFCATFGAPFFGMWSDGRARKTSMTIVALCTIIRFIPFAFLPPAQGLSVYVVTDVLTAPFIAQTSGSPVLWAWMSDVLPVEHRELGFSLVFALGSLASWAAGTLASAVVSAYKLPPQTFYWSGLALIGLALLLIITSPSMAPPAADDDEQLLSPRHQRKGLKDLMLKPLRLVSRKRSLRLICAVAAFVTLPDIAVSHAALPIVYVILGVDGRGHRDAQAAVSNWFISFPNIFMLPLFATIGVFAKRFGPARTLAVWTPITCVFFSTTALLHWVDSPPVEVMCGLTMLAPITIYPPLQALVAILVPSNRIGEAMGAVAACKNLASLAAPLIMNVAVSAMSERHDLYWTLFPGGALLMLAGAWPFTVLLAKRVQAGQDGDLDWSVWSSISGMSSHWQTAPRSHRSNAPGSLTSATRSLRGDASG